MEQTKLKLKKRAFNLIAPIVFNQSIIEDLLGILSRLREKEDLQKLEQMLHDKDTQHEFFFGDRRCLPVEDFERIARKQLGQYSLASLQNVPLSEFYVALEQQVDHLRLDCISNDLHNKEFLLWKSLKPWSIDQKNALTFRRLLSTFIVYDSFFNDTEDIAELLTYLEQSNVRI